MHDFDILAKYATLCKILSSKDLMKKNLLGILMLLFVANAKAAYQDELTGMPAGQKWVMGRANSCLMADDITHVAANGQCLAIQTYMNELPTPHPILVVFIHGDGIPGGSPSDYLKFQATHFVTDHVVPVVLIRPGYYDSYGHYSTGNSYAFAVNGYPSDGYRADVVTTLADAVMQLKQFYHPSCTILVGHSGGAMMSGIILGKYPDLANGAVLASVTYNVHAWAKKHGWGSWPNSLSPSDWVNQVPKQDFVYVISGTADTNTYPEMTLQYVNALKQAGVNTHFVSVPGGDHNSVVLDDAQAFDSAISDAISNCPAH